MKPLISIVVPCYNQAQYMDECLQSVLGQTYTNWECIIVNDGSPDHTEEIAKKWCDKDVRFRYLYKENGGLSSARNAGIETAKGKWVLPLDSDDKVGISFLELAVQKILNGATFVYGEVQLFGEDTYKISNTSFVKDQLLYKNPFCCSCIFEKAKFIEVGGYDEKLIHGIEDWEFWINLLYNTSNKVSFVDTIAIYYRRKKVSMNTMMTTSKAKELAARTYIINKHSQLYIAGMDMVNDLFYKNQHYQNVLKEYNQIPYIYIYISIKRLKNYSNDNQ